VNPYVVVADHAEWRDDEFVAFGVRAEGNRWAATADRATGDPSAPSSLW
jgi:hypothetical protein